MTSTAPLTLAASIPENTISLPFVATVETVPPRLGTLIGKNLLAMARHYTPPVGSAVTFETSKGRLSTTVQSVVKAWGDALVVRLSDDVSSVVPVAPIARYHDITSVSNFMAVGLQDKKTPIVGATSLRTLYPLLTGLAKFSQPPTAVLQPGDSGAPIFVQVGDEWKLVGTNYSITPRESFTNVFARYADEIASPLSGHHALNNKNMKHISILLLSTAVSASAQLIVSDQPASGVALAIQSDVAILGYAQTSQPAFTTAGLDFNLVSNYNLGDLVVGSGVGGTFFANVSFIARESMRPNHFGVSDASLAGYGAGGTTLFLDYTEADKPVSKAISAVGYEEINFWHYADKAGFEGTFFMNEGLSFRTWESVDVVNNTIYTLFGIDDLRTSFIDFNDGVFLLERNLLPISDEITPVPEPSTWALFGVGALGLVMARRKLSSRKPLVA